MPLTRAWTQLRYHEKQAAAWRSKCKFVNLACGRGSGKTELARRRCVRYLPVKKPWSDPIYFYALPTYLQARRVVWNPLKQLIPPHWTDNGKLVNETQMSITTIFGSVLYVLGLDKPQRIEGVQWDGGVIDEACDQKPGVFDLSIMPTLSHRDSWVWRIGVPKRYGIGAGEFKQFYMRGREDDPDRDPDIISYTWPSSDILVGGDQAKRLEAAKRILDPRDFSEQYEASWEDASGAIFWAFQSREAEGNVSDEIRYNEKEPILVGSDFNVDPMAWVLCHKRGEELHVFDEVWLRNANTPSTLDYLSGKYSGHDGGWVFMGDSTGQARKTSATSSDYMHIKNDERFTPKKVAYLSANPMTSDRFAASNAAFLNAKKERRTIVHPRCKRLIHDLEHRSYKMGTREADDYGDLGHISDALGYIQYPFYAVRGELRSMPPEVILKSGTGNN